jgi:hypothetical protein
VTQCDKINVAALGNVVPQLHIHIVARCKTDPQWPKPVLGGGTAARERSGGVCAICRGDSGEARRCGSALSAEPVPCCVEFAASWCCRTNSRMAAPNFPVTTCDWFVPIPRP